MRIEKYHTVSFYINTRLTLLQRRHSVYAYIVDDKQVLLQSYSFPSFGQLRSYYCHLSRLFISAVYLVPLDLRLFLSSLATLILVSSEVSFLPDILQLLLSSVNFISYIYHRLSRGMSIFFFTFVIYFHLSEHQSMPRTFF